MTVFGNMSKILILVGTFSSGILSLIYLQRVVTVTLLRYCLWFLSLIGLGIYVVNFSGTRFESAFFNMHATNSWPFPTTATCLTKGCDEIISSISNGRNLLSSIKTISFNVPCTYRYPSVSNCPISPLLKYPLSKAAVVPSGFFKYLEQKID